MDDNDDKTDDEVMQPPAADADVDVEPNNEKDNDKKKSKKDRKSSKKDDKKKRKKDKKKHNKSKKDDGGIDKGSGHSFSSSGVSASSYDEDDGEGASGHTPGSDEDGGDDLAYAAAAMAAAEAKMTAAEDAAMAEVAKKGAELDDGGDNEKEEKVDAKKEKKKKDKKDRDSKKKKKSFKKGAKEEDVEGDKVDQEKQEEQKEQKAPGAEADEKRDEEAATVDAQQRQQEQQQELEDQVNGYLSRNLVPAVAVAAAAAPVDEPASQERFNDEEGEEEDEDGEAKDGDHDDDVVTDLVGSGSSHRNRPTLANTSYSLSSSDLMVKHAKESLALSMSNHSNPDGNSLDANSAHSARAMVRYAKERPRPAMSSFKSARGLAKSFNKDDPLGSGSSRHSAGSGGGPRVLSGSSHHKNATISSKAMVSQGFKYGVRELSTTEIGAMSAHKSSRSIMSDDDDDGSDGDSFNNEDPIFWDDGGRNIHNPFLKHLVNVLVCLRCMPAKPIDSTPLKNTLRGLQWAAILLDMTAAIVAIATFSGNTLCCGQPVLNSIGSAPWDVIVPAAAYVYLALIVAEIYPAVHKGFPFNVVNPIFGSALTVAMFFDDSVSMALSMWGIECLAVLCECSIYCLKAKQKRDREREISRLGLLTKRDREPEESEVRYEKDLKKTRQQFFQLKAEHKYENKALWWLLVANVLNLILVGSVLVLIVFVYRAGGLCIEMGTFPNPFDSDQVARCYDCTTDPSQPCDLCTEGGQNMCYYPYS